METAVKYRDVVARTGISSVQLTRWLDAGAITLSDRSRGSGNYRTYTDRECRVLAALLRLQGALAAISEERGGFGVPTPLVRRIWDGLQHADVVVIREAPITIHIDLNETP